MARIRKRYERLVLAGLALSGVAGAAIALAIPVAPRDEPSAMGVRSVSAPVAAPAVDDPFVLKGVLTLDAPLTHGSFAWNESGVPDGPVVVTIDLKAETLSVFRAGYEIGVAAILFGTDDKPTPLGRHQVRWKKADHWSSRYDAAMPYTLNLTGDGVAIHGSDVDWGSATHGCIGVPLDFARLLFAEVGVGDPVIVTAGRRLPTT